MSGGMTMRALDGSGDWIFGTGLNAYNVAQNAIAENIQTRILSWVGDCFFDLNNGVDWRNLLDRGQSKNLLEAVKTIILRSYGVVGVNSVVGNLNTQTRNFVITYNISTIYTSTFQASIMLNAGVSS